ncbi:MAG: FAD-dependent oxidoreductase [Anaerolineaceae bacterium]|jgi:glycine/D-amino acid oxidase-like deaminating enzyme|nr:FAD-dependent oxidoreductase [Anaerolineaceae bacterium]OQY87897.1 MAG: FAD-dependent oxidoreductase [Anaerolineae bacterium UTCFX1]
MIYSSTPSSKAKQAVADVSHTPFWLDDPAKPNPEPPLTQNISTDLLIIGAGYTGLWTALLAKEENPNRDVIIVEAGEAAIGASGRNGGFMDASITHGFLNGQARWPHEIKTLHALGVKNLAEIETTLARYNIECDRQRTGDIDLATEAHMLEDFHKTIALAQQYGIEFQFLDRDQLQSIVKSPLFLGGIKSAEAAIVNPAQLAWGLRKACLDLGVRLYEQTPVTKLIEENDKVVAHTPHAKVRANKVALATNAFPPLLKRISHYVIPVYDYVLTTEPLTVAQCDSIGWHGREGLSDASNQFHYFRTTADGRILWGGFDAIYHWNNGFGSHLENRPASFALLADHFFQAFPALEGLRFTHAWGGAIDTCSRFSPFWGSAHRGKTAYAMGYTGLGVGATRFGAQVILDILDNRKTERTELEMVRTKPLPFPPEPLRSIGINLSRWSLARADNHGGEENLWLKLMDRMGLGFDS